jgi:hypothetical protein
MISDHVLPTHFLQSNGIVTMGWEHFSVKKLYTSNRENSWAFLLGIVTPWFFWFLVFLSVFFWESGLVRGLGSSEIYKKLRPRGFTTLRAFEGCQQYPQLFYLWKGAAGAEGVKLPHGAFKLWLWEGEEFLGHKPRQNNTGFLLKCHQVIENNLSSGKPWRAEEQDVWGINCCLTKR